MASVDSGELILHDDAIILIELPLIDPLRQFFKLTS